MTTVDSSEREARADLYVPMSAQVVDVQQMTDLEVLLRAAFDGGRPLDHCPGQFVQVSVLGVGECPISVCSSPTRPDYFELCVRRVGEVTAHIHRLEKGSVIGIRGPLGRGFDVAELHGKDILIVAGGLGIAPARSLIQYVLDERQQFGAFHLLYGVRSPAELLYRDDLTLWRESPDVNFHVTVDRPDEQWRGRSGVVTTLFRELPQLDPTETMVAIIGPPLMFKFAVLEVLARRIPQNSIYCSLERRMKCGVGICGHCQVNNVYACLDGPVFKYGQLKALREALE
ncbi:MAG: FAD/NAD(P)-binding protein [Phycisphaerales bacterium]|nr:MAG: FAD/NAD(P)-binding protein [Phycisphaerales bacterium]